MPITIADHLRAHLITAGLVRDPRVPGTLPPCWRQKGNTPAPGEGSNDTEKGTDAVVNLLHLDGIPAPRFDRAHRRDMVEIRIRSFSWPRIEQLYVQIREQTIDKTDWTMGTLYVIESEEWTTLGMTDATELSGGQTLYSGRSGVLFETFAAAWAFA